MDLALGLKPIQRWRLQIPKLQDRTEKSFLRFLKSSSLYKELLDAKQMALESAFFDDSLKITEEDLKKLDEEVTEIMKNRKKIKKDSPATPAKTEESNTGEQLDESKSKEKQVKVEDESATTVPSSEIKKEDELTEEQKKLIEDLQTKLNELKSQKSKSFTLLKNVIDEEEKLKKEKKVLKQQQQQMYSNDPKSPLSASIAPPHSPMSSPLMGHYQNIPTTGIAIPPHQTLHMQQLPQPHHGMHPQPPPPPIQIPQNISTTQANLISGNEMIPPQHQMVHSASQGSLPTPPSAGNTTPSSSHYHRDHHYHQPTYSGHYSHSLPPYTHSNYHHPSSNVYHPPQTNAVPPTGLQQGLLHTPSISATAPSSTIMDNNANPSGRNAPPTPMPPPGHNSGFDSPYGVNPPMQATGMHHAPFSHFSRHGLPPPPPPSYHNEMPPQHHHHHSYHAQYHVPPPRGQNYYQPYGAPPRFNIDRGGHSRTHQRNWR